MSLIFVPAYVVNGVRYEFPHMCPDVGRCAVARWVSARHSREYFRGESLSDFTEKSGQFAEEVGK